jgi:GDP-L-fucose synthase
MIGKNDQIFVAGHTGMVGSAVVRLLNKSGYKSIITRTRKQLDLRNRDEVVNFFNHNSPKAVVLAAARVGGIAANNADQVGFLLDNMKISTNVIESAANFMVKKLVFLGSSCIYPKDAPQPISEDALMKGEFEPTNRGYAIAKISGIELCRAYKRQLGVDFVSLQPTNLYGPNDRYDVEKSHVIPAMVMKFSHAAKKGLPSVELFGTGKPLREFLHVDDLASAVVKVLESDWKWDLTNVGSGFEISISDLASIIARETGFKGNIVWNTERPDGTMRKLVDSSKIISTGWKPSVNFENGIAETCRSYLNLIAREN